jgi:hypothetical protein
MLFAVIQYREKKHNSGNGLWFENKCFVQTAWSLVIENTGGGAVQKM